MTRTEKWAERAEECRRKKAIDAPICVNCKFYHPHYEENGNQMGCGHCTQPRKKYKNYYDTCDGFQAKLSAAELEAAQAEIDQYNRDKQELEERGNALRKKYGIVMLEYFW